MAVPGIGYRTVNSLLVEVSFHLLEPVANTTLEAFFSAGTRTALVSSTVGIYVGCLLIVGLNSTDQEVVTVTAVVEDVSFTAVFANNHATGDVILTATFPVQQPTDPFFTQSEMLSYVSRAQNELLAQVPCIFQLSTQLATVNTIYQTSPATMIELERIALSAAAISLTSLTRSADVVTAISPGPHGLTRGEAFSILSPSSAPISDTTFLGAFSVASVVSTTEWTYAQAAANGSATGGVAGLWARLYERTQEDIAAIDRNWQLESAPSPTSWFEDRAGNYRWGLARKPSSTFPVELLCSVRDTDSLALTDGFLVPDIFVHIIKYKVLEYAFSKDGEQRSPDREKYCKQRFETGVLAIRRWLDGVMEANS